VAVGVLLTGTVRTEGSHEPIPYATVEIVELGRRATTDPRGSFALPDLPAGNWSVRAAAPGYAARVETIRLDSGRVVLDLVLSPAPLALAPLAVQASPAGAARAGPGTERLNAGTLKTLPGFAETDVLRALRDLPAVASSSDFSSALYVRGGTPDQTRVLLDGAPLLNPYHMGGIFAAVDPEAVSALELDVGGLPASVGNSLSGELRIFTREGSRDRIRGNGSLGLVSSRASLDGPLPGRGAFLLSWRRTYLDLFTSAAYRAGLASETFPYAFDDLFLKATYDVGQSGKLSLSAYSDREHLDTPAGFNISGQLGARWGSRAGSATYRHLLSSGLLAEAQVAGSRFDGRFLYGGEGGASADSLAADVGMDIATARISAIRYGARSELRFGVEAEQFASRYDVRSGGATMLRYFPPLLRRDQLTTAALYAEGERGIGSLELRLGARLFWRPESTPLLLPRLGFTLPLNEDIEVVGAAGRYAQALTTLRDEESTAARLFAYDLLLPVAEGAPVPTAEDAVLGVRFRRGTTRIAVDGYLKWMHDLSLPPLPADPDEAAILVAEGRRPASGSARGVELSAEHQLGALRLSAAYALSEHTRTMDGERFTPGFATTHRTTLTASRQLGGSGLISTRLVWASGLPYTHPSGFTRAFRYDPATSSYVPAGEVMLSGEHNNGRLPSYHRIDVMLRRSFAPGLFGGRGVLTPYLQLYNLLNTRNVLRAAPGLYDTEPRLEYAPQLPLLPTIGVEWRF
jgi:hypothetical protein